MSTNSCVNRFTSSTSNAAPSSPSLPRLRLVSDVGTRLCNWFNWFDWDNWRRCDFETNTAEGMVNDETRETLKVEVVTARNSNINGNGNHADPSGNLFEMNESAAVWERVAIIDIYELFRNSIFLDPPVRCGMIRYSMMWYFVIDLILYHS